MNRTKRYRLRTYKTERAAQRYIDNVLAKRFPLATFAVAPSPRSGDFTYAIKCVRSMSTDIPSNVYLSR